MAPHDRILVALSGTDSDRALILYASTLASRQFARHFFFVHVRTPARIAEDNRSDGEVLEECHRRVREMFVGIDPSVTTTCHILNGVRIDELIGFIAAHHCTVAVLGHRKSRSGQRSLARRMAMIAPCSIWLVPESAPIRLQNILIPVDFSDHSIDGVKVATELAVRFEAKQCLALHVSSTDPTTIRYDDHEANTAPDLTETVRQFLAPLERHGVDVQPLHLESKEVARTILQTAKDRESDLIVMNTRGRSRAASILLGSITGQVMSEANIAVYAVKHFGAMVNLFQALKQSQFWNRENPKTN